MIIQQDYDNCKTLYQLIKLIEERVEVPGHFYALMNFYEAEYGNMAWENIYNGMMRFEISERVKKILPMEYIRKRAGY